MVAEVQNVRPTIKATLEQEAPAFVCTPSPEPQVVVELQEPPSVKATLQEEATIETSIETMPTAEIAIPAFTCEVSEADITVLATADQEPLRTADGGYLRLQDDEEEEDPEEP